MHESAAPPDPAEESEVRALPVLAEPRPVELPPPATLPAVVVAATSGFLLGVASFVLLRLLRRPRAAIRLANGRRRRAEVAATRSFLVDVHLLRDR